MWLQSSTPKCFYLIENNSKCFKTCNYIMWHTWIGHDNNSFSIIMFSIRLQEFQDHKPIIMLLQLLPLYLSFRVIGHIHGNREIFVCREKPWVTGQYVHKPVIWPSNINQISFCNCDFHILIGYILSGT